MSPEELKDIPSVAGTLNEALDALEADHDWLLKGDVFTKDVIDMWLEYKRENEVDAVRMRPTPTEFALYFDC
jgi:glutamine synthetase